MLAVESDSFEMLKSCMHGIFSEDEKRAIDRTNEIIESHKIHWLLDKIQSKIDNMFNILI